MQRVGSHSQKKRCGRLESTLSPEEDVVDVPPDVRADAQELAVDAVENGLEKISLPSVLRVKQLQELDHKGLVDVSLGQRHVQL